LELASNASVATHEKIYKGMIKMKHPKMQYTYVGIDSHKHTHTAVFLDCFFEKLGEITFENLPSKFCEFLSQATKFRMDGTEFLFGLEDTSSYGRTLAVFLNDNCQQVKHVNALLVARERKNRNITEKTDSVDAECAARVLLSKFGELPDAVPDDKFYILRTLVMRRNFILRNNVALKNHLHSILTQHYPNYDKFFPDIYSMSALAFFYEYPSPSSLENVSLDELTNFLKEHSTGNVGKAKAEQILSGIEIVSIQFQEIRDEAVRSTLRQIRTNLTEIEQTELSMGKFLKQFDCTLTSMNGIDTVTACQILSCIGDIKKFSTAAKLARYAGIAPVTYASGQRDLQFANQRGNRELNSIFYMLSMRFACTLGHNKRQLNPFFYEYYHRKISEGKTKRQALKCVQRRLVNIIWTMLTRNEEYINPPMIELPKELDNTEENVV